MTLEAIIAVVIIFLFIYSVMFDSSKVNEGDKVKEKMSFVLKEISLNEEYRECIVGLGDGSIKDKCGFDEFIDFENYELCVGYCDLDVKGDVFVSSIFVSAVLDKKIDKEVYLYVW